MPIRVTGGLGFIGSAYVNHLRHATTEPVVVLDAEYYAADRARVENAPRLSVVRAKLQAWPVVLDLLREYCITSVVHFAAASHVSASFRDPLDFCEENVVHSGHVINTNSRLVF